jgi:hypothetical protein
MKGFVRRAFANPIEVATVILAAVLGVFATYYLFMTAASLVGAMARAKGYGAGYGVGGPLWTMGQPFLLFLFMWPVLFGAAFASWRYSGPVVVLGLGMHIVAVLVKGGVPMLRKDYELMAGHGDAYLKWLIPYLLMVAGLLIAGTFKWVRAARGSRKQEG